MTDPQQNTEAALAPNQQSPGRDGDKQTPSEDKTRSRKGLIALAIIAVASVGVPTAWAVYLSVQLLRAPVSLPRPNDYQAALSNILELQDLALSEAEAGRPAFFVAHMGCVAPPVWQNDRMLKKLKRMVELGVEVKLLGGLTGHNGLPLPSPDWPKQFEDKLKEHGILDGIVCHMLPKELWNHSVVAGSEQRSQAYITSHEKLHIYPTTYFTVRDNEACQEWKRNLLKQFPAGVNPSTRPL